MKLNHNTYVGKKYLYFITYNVLRGLKHLIRTHLKIELSCRAAVLRDVNDCALAIYHYWRESDWCNWIYSAHTVQIWSVPADYEELAGGIKGAVLWKLPWVPETFLPLVASAYGRRCVGLRSTPKLIPAAREKNLWYPGYMKVGTATKVSETPK